MCLSSGSQGFDEEGVVKEGVSGCVCEKNKNSRALNEGRPRSQNWKVSKFKAAQISPILRYSPRPGISVRKPAEETSLVGVCNASDRLFISLPSDGRNTDVTVAGNGNKDPVCCDSALVESKYVLKTCNATSMQSETEF